METKFESGSNNIDDETRADELDALLDGRANLASSGLEPELVAIARMYQTLGNLPVPSGAKERVAGQLALLKSASVHSNNHVGGSPLADSILLEPRRNIPRNTTFRPSRALNYAALAAIVTCLVIGGLILSSRGDRPGSLPAVAPNATTAAEARDVTLVDITLPAAALPAGDAGASFVNATIRPGVTTKWRIQQHVSVVYLLSGTLTVRSDATLSVQRSGTKAWADVLTGTDVTMEPGDAVLVIEAKTVSYDNNGNESVELIDWALGYGNSTGNPIPNGWILHDFDRADFAGPAGVVLPGTDGHLRIYHAALESGDSIAPPAGVLTMMGIVIESDAPATPAAATLNHGSNGTLEVQSGGLEVYVALLEGIGVATPVS